MSKLLLAGGGLLSMILSALGCTPEPKGSPLIVEAAANKNECNVSVNHQRVTSRRLLQIASSGDYTWGIVRMNQRAPYKCVGAVILTLQEGGLTTVKAEPLPTP